MPDSDRAMLACVWLAAVSHEKQQLGGRDRFLILAGAAACRAGHLDVAERCRELTIAHNPLHILTRYASFPNALRSDDFATFLKQIERFCGYERAEHLLRELGIDADAPEDAETDRGVAALEVLSRIG